MIRSMTGYGSADLERDGQRLSAEIRSVNHRFCEVSVRAPKLVGLFEDQIRQLIQDAILSELRRRKYVYFRSSAESQKVFAPDHR